MKYSILLPVYNQAENLPLVLYLLYQVSFKNDFIFEIIIVEDNSPDKTREVAKKLIKFYETKIHNNKFQIKILERQGKLGLGSAYREGLNLCSGQFVIIMDADLSHHPKYIPEMISKQKKQNADIVCSTRYVKEGGVQGWNFMRKLTSRTANYIASIALSSQFTDLTGSYRLYKKEILKLLISEVKTKGYSFQMQILIRAWKNKMKIIEQPIIFVDRLYGRSKLGPNQVFTYLKGVVKLFLDY